MLLAISVFVLATSFPSTAKTSWMSPQSFHLTIGMTRSEAVGKLQEGGWTAKAGRDDDELVVDYSDDKAMTLEFRRNRLRSVRFELFAMLPEIRSAFEEQRSRLRKDHGDPPKSARSGSVIVYDDRLPNIIVVLGDDPQSEYGKKGIGYLAVRYYDPIAALKSTGK